MKTGKTYDGTVLLADTGGKYVNYRIERRDKNEKTASIGSVATHPEKSLSRPFCRVGDFLFGEAPIPCMTDALVGLISFRFTFQNRIALLYYA